MTLFFPILKALAPFPKRGVIALQTLICDLFINMTLGQHDSFDLDVPHPNTVDSRYLDFGYLE